MKSSNKKNNADKFIQHIINIQVIEYQLDYIMINSSDNVNASTYYDHIFIIKSRMCACVL